jgi:hypothetical protein
VSVPNDLPGSFYLYPTATKSAIRLLNKTHNIRLIFELLFVLRRIPKLDVAGSIPVSRSNLRSRWRKLASHAKVEPDTRCVRCGLVGYVRRERIVSGMHVELEYTCGPQNA